MYFNAIIQHFRIQFETINSKSQEFNKKTVSCSPKMHRGKFHFISKPHGKITELGKKVLEPCKDTFIHTWEFSQFFSSFTLSYNYSNLKMKTKNNYFNITNYFLFIKKYMNYQLVTAKEIRNTHELFLHGVSDNLAMNWLHTINPAHV